MNRKDPERLSSLFLSLLISLLVVVSLAPVFGQTDRRVTKADKLFKKGKTQKAINLMQEVVDQNPTVEHWDKLIGLYHDQYINAKNNGMEGLMLALSKSLDSTLKSVNYSGNLSYYETFISKCREAGLVSQCRSASMYLRSYCVDYNPDTAVAEPAQKEFNIAERYFGAADYKNAKIHYLNALKIYPKFYKATIYGGDMYWHLKQMDSAVYYFKKGIEMHSNLLEPHKYLVDALWDAGRNEEATFACLNAICIYPDEVMFNKLRALLKENGKTLNRHWIKRGCDVNTVGLVRLNSEDPTDGSWKTYKNAFNDVKMFTDSSGIIRPNDVTKTKYLEVYSWEKILSSSTLPSSFDFAKKMQQEGFLDCYVFVSMFHFDCYPQFLDFASQNKEKMKLYMQKYMAE